MTSSNFKITKLLLITMPLIYGTVVFAGESKISEKQESHLIKSVLPVSATQLNEITLKQLQNHKKTIATKEINSSLLNEATYGGGYGGNQYTSMLIYDGLPGHQAALIIRRDDKNKKCFLENQYAGIYHYNFWGSLKPVSYECLSANKFHNGIYWNETLDPRNGGYSADNDALYASMMINKMYQEWFDIPATKKPDGSPLALKIVTHYDLGDAYESDGQLVLGDGDRYQYPFTSPGIVSFLMAFAFTAQHSNLDFSKPSSGAISVAFSMMADQAMKFYIDGQNDWQLGSEISKNGQPYYYMDQPSKDCGTRAPGNDCSIDHMTQYKASMGAHYGSGPYRRALYLLSTTPGWDIKKTFSVMVQANRFYWTKHLDFTRGVCGLIKAARDFKYDESAVIDAFNQVGVNSQSC